MPTVVRAAITIKTRTNFIMAMSVIEGQDRKGLYSLPLFGIVPPKFGGNHVSGMGSRSTPFNKSVGRANRREIQDSVYTGSNGYWDALDRSGFGQRRSDIGGIQAHDKCRIRWYAQPGNYR